jgi:glycosyltransferase involved in cell wall biosynthesis
LKKLAVIITHPIQYYVPLFQLLAKSCELKIFYTWGADGAKAKYDPDFNQLINWDLPLLEGYEYEFLLNTAKDPGSHHFNGIINPTLKEQITDFNPKAILIYGWAYHSHLQTIRYFKGKIPLWFRGDSTILNLKKGLKQIMRSIYLSWVYKHIDIAFYVGIANKAYFKKFGLTDNQLIFAPHAVDNNRFAEDREIEALAFRRQLQLTDDQILILFAGKLEANKNPEILLKAFLELNLVGVHLLFVGNGELEEKLKAKKILQQSQYTNTNNVHFINFQNQTSMPVVYQACNVFCLPSQSETWGLAVNEAMACAKAILVSDKVGCAEDLVKNGKNGYIFESNNIESLKSKLRLLLGSNEDIIEMGKSSATIINSWTIAAQGKSILKELAK